MSVSLARSDLAVLRRHAREHFDGNLSAAFAEAARLLRQREARRQLVDLLGGPTLAPGSAAAIAVEQDGARRATARRGRAA